MGFKGLELRSSGLRVSSFVLSFSSTKPKAKLGRKHQHQLVLLYRLELHLQSLASAQEEPDEEQPINLGALVIRIGFL